ncbi:MAG: GSU2403 family nucleotidyltransferase fold protein [Candidatus Competibacter sp.]|nr:GSU2403 family nucleotidyltransferase fold protein [Candidatus Competibacter sp.]
MTPYPLPIQTLYADLVQRRLDAEFDKQFDPRGSFILKEVKGRHYWYYQRRIGRRVRTLYVGPQSDSAIQDRVQAFGRAKADTRQCREIVRALLAAGLHAPDPVSGHLLEVLANAGFFRLRGVLVGTLAYQNYPGLIGTRLPAALLMTQDADLAQFYDVSHAVGESLPPMIELLHSVDPTFAPIADPAAPLHTTRYRSASGYAVDFLTPNRGSDDNTGHPSLMPALGGASATPLRFLDYLIHQTARAVALHGPGVPIVVPPPERYAIHKLIVATQRNATPTKIDKDIFQASALLSAYLPQRAPLVAEAYADAISRGSSWRKHLTAGKSMLPSDIRSLLEAAVLP